MKWLVYVYILKTLYAQWWRSTEIGDDQLKPHLAWRQCCAKWAGLTCLRHRLTSPPTAVDGALMEEEALNWEIAAKAHLIHKSLQCPAALRLPWQWHWRSLHIHTLLSKVNASTCSVIFCKENEGHESVISRLELLALVSNSIYPSVVLPPLHPCMTSLLWLLSRMTHTHSSSGKQNLLIMFSSQICLQSPYNNLICYFNVSVKPGTKLTNYFSLCFCCRACEFPSCFIELFDFDFEHHKY